MSTKKQNVVKSTSKTSKSVKTKDEREASRDRLKKIEDLTKKTTSVKTSKPTQELKKTTTKNATTVKKIVPNSPTSSRVAKTQYFPNSKQLYSNALSPADKLKIKAQLQPKQKVTTRVSKESKSTPRVTKDTKSKETISKETISKKTISKETISKETKSDSTVERPSTATLRRGSIVNMNIAGPDVPNVTVPQQEPEDDYNYEDDFDSYASDFEEYNSSSGTSNLSVSTNDELSSSSSEDISLPKTIEKRINSAEEEKKLDSGNFDLPENKHKPILGGITENALPLNLSSLSDEGFEEAKSLQFVNFLGAKKKRDRERSLRNKNKRGEELMSMIRLDTRNFTLFDMPAVSYETYIKSFGNRNSLQVASQTGDDNISEEIQTDFIETANKWTQFPTKFSKLNETDENYMNIYKTEFLGVGTDTVQTTNQDVNYNEYKLDKFLQNVGKVILTILDENNQTHAKEIEADSRKLPFSEGFVPLNTRFLDNRVVAHVSFSSSNNMKILSIHEPQNAEDDLSLKSIGCIWNIANPSEPEDVFSTFGTISSCCFSISNNKVIFGGLHDGIVTLWNLSDTSRAYNYIDIDSEIRILVKPVSFSTPIDVEYSSKIVAICSFYESAKRDMSGDGFISSVQVLTLDEVGNLIKWGLITKPGTGDKNHKYLVRNSVVQISITNPDLQDLQCTDMSLDLEDPDHIYVSTNYGYTIHCLASGARSNPRKYAPAVTCKASVLQTCPHSGEYFIVGFGNGNISLYSRSVEKPLITMCNQENDADVDVVEWSQHRPCLFYTKDSKNIVHVWDLSFSELIPTFSVPFNEDVKFIKLSPSNHNGNQIRTYMAIVTRNGSIDLHVLNKEHGRQTNENYQSELKIFKNYVTRL